MCTSKYETNKGDSDKVLKFPTGIVLLKKAFLQIRESLSSERHCSFSSLKNALQCFPFPKKVNQADWRSA